ncbi:MAG TPA: adenosylcobinamide-GDP ribazoletransferase [Burkholderiaceae bacterium]
MTDELRLFFTALRFLTRVPVPRRVGFEPAWLQACLRHFPLVGACIGAWAAAVFWLALLVWPPLVASAVSLVATVWLTGAFHEDGLADTCDALGGAVSRERALAIMKDSRIGSYGAVALVLALVLKVTAVAGLASSAQTDGLAWAAMALIWSHAVSRAAPVWLVWRLPYAGDAEQAKAKPLAMRASGMGLAVAGVWVGVASAAAVAVTVWTGASSWTASLWAALSALAACASATLCCARWLRRRLGGFTGDTLGATQQIVELVGLLTWLAWLPHAGGHHA